MLKEVRKIETSNFRIVDIPGAAIPFVQNEHAVKKEWKLYQKASTGEMADGVIVLAGLSRAAVDSEKIPSGQKFNYNFGNSVINLNSCPEGLIEFIDEWKPGYFTVSSGPDAVVIERVYVYDMPEISAKWGHS